MMEKSQTFSMNRTIVLCFVKQYFVYTILIIHKITRRIILDLQSSIKVLHIDDDPSICNVTKMFLERLDPHIHIDSFSNPLDVVELYSNYDCVISDFKMPGMNGIELSEKIRESSSIPIILYTGQGSEEVAESAFSIGINDYVRKEFHHIHFNLLVNRVRQTVQRSRAESALIESESRYRALIEFTYDLIQSVYLTGALNM